jgi:uncharacterized protein (DUF1501 family)
VALLAGGALKGGCAVAGWFGVNEAGFHKKRDLKATTDVPAVLEGLLKDHLRLAGAIPDGSAVQPTTGLVG